MVIFLFKTKQNPRIHLHSLVNRGNGRRDVGNKTLHHVIDVVGGISISTGVVAVQIYSEVGIISLKFGLKNLKLVGKVKVLVEKDLTLNAFGKSTGHVNLEAICFTLMGK